MEWRRNWKRYNDSNNRTPTIEETQTRGVMKPQQIYRPLDNKSLYKIKQSLIEPKFSFIDSINLLNMVSLLILYKT